MAEYGVRRRRDVQLRPDHRDRQRRRWRATCCAARTIRGCSTRRTSATTAAARACSPICSTPRSRKYAARATFPVVSPTMDDLAEKVKARMALDASGVSATHRARARKLTVRVMNAATVPVTGLCTPAAESLRGPADLVPRSSPPDSRSRCRSPTATRGRPARRWPGGHGRQHRGPAASGTRRDGAARRRSARSATATGVAGPGAPDAGCGLPRVRPRGAARRVGAAVRHRRPWRWRALSARRPLIPRDTRRRARRYGAVAVRSSTRGSGDRPKSASRRLTGDPTGFRAPFGTAAAASWKAGGACEDVGAGGARAGWFLEVGLVWVWATSGWLRRRRRSRAGGGGAQSAGGPTGRGSAHDAAADAAPDSHPAPDTGLAFTEGLTVDARVLVITADGTDAAVDAITQTLRYLGTPFDVLNATTGPALNLDDLVVADHGRYYGDRARRRRSRGRGTRARSPMRNG